MLLGRRHETEAHGGLNRDSDSRVQIPRTMMAAVAYATEFGGLHDPAVFGGQSPAYVAKWLYSLASNRNDSALRFITNSPYIEVPARSVTRGISRDFTARLKSFAGIIISEAPKGSRTYQVTYDTDSSPPVQFMMAFFVMRLCYARAARHIAKYNKNEPESSEPNTRFIDDQRAHAGEIENIFNAFYQGAVAAENDADNKNKKNPPVDPDIRRYFRENLALTPAKNENARMRLGFIRTLERSVTEGVITSTRRAMQIMITDINAVLGSIKNKREHGSDGAESIEENPRAATSPVKQASSVPKKRASLEPKENKSEKGAGAETKSEGLDTQKKTSSKAHGKAKKSNRVNPQKHSNDEQEEESHATVNIALVGVDDTTKRVLTNLNIITKDWYYTLQENTDASEVADKISLLIVWLRARKEKYIKRAIERYVEWQKQKGKQRNAIFVSSSSEKVWSVIKSIADASDDTAGQNKRLFYAPIQDGSSSLYLYWFFDGTDNVKKASDSIHSALGIANGTISWEEYTVEDEGDDDTDTAYEETPVTKDANKEGGTKAKTGSESDVDTDTVHSEETKKVANPEKHRETSEGGKAKAGPSIPKDAVKAAVARVVKKRTGHHDYKTVYDTDSAEEDDVSLIFVVLPTDETVKKKYKQKEHKKQQSVEDLVTRYLEWQNKGQGRLAVFVAVNDEPSIEKDDHSDSSVFVHTYENFHMYCIVKGDKKKIKHKYLNQENWTRLESDDPDSQKGEGEEEVIEGSADTDTVPANIELFGISEEEEEEVEDLFEKITKGGVYYHSNKEYTDAGEGTRLAIVGLKSNNNTKDRINKYVTWQNEESDRLVVFADLSNGNKSVEKNALESTPDGLSLYYSDLDLEGKQISLYCFGGEESPSHELMKNEIKWTKLEKPEPEPEQEQEPELAKAPAPVQDAQDANAVALLTIDNEDYSIPTGVLNEDEAARTKLNIKLNIKEFLDLGHTYKVIVVPYNTVVRYVRSLEPDEAGKKGKKEKKRKKGKEEKEEKKEKGKKGKGEEQKSAEEEKKAAGAAGAGEEEKEEEEEGKKGPGTADGIKKLINNLKERSSVIVFLCKDDSEWTKARVFVHPKGEKETEWHSWLMRLSGGDNEASSGEKSPKSPFEMAVRCVKEHGAEIGRGWFPISKRSLTDTDATQSVICIDETYKINIHIASKITKDIREAGIRMALDYVSSTETDTNTKGICTPSTKKENIQNLMTKAQELVYLTLSSLDPVRIYALAPGAGKTRCMALALFCSMVDIGTGSHYCVVMHTENMIVAYDQIVNEIMKSIYDGDDPAVLHESEYRDIGTALLVKEHGIDGATNIKGDKRKAALDLTIKALKSNNITILTHQQLTDEIGKCELRYKCIIADECHHVIGTLSDSANSKNVKNVERFIGFSATPFKNKEDLESLRGWARRMSAESALVDLKSANVQKVVSGSKPKQTLDERNDKHKTIIDMLENISSTVHEDNGNEASATYADLRKKAGEYITTMTNTQTPKGQQSADGTVTTQSMDAAILELRLASRKLGNVRTMESFVASSVVYADERDVTRMLPYALIAYETIVATGLDVSVSNKKLFSVSIKQDKNDTVYYDYKEQFDEADYGAAIDKVLELLLDQGNTDSRSLVYIHSGSKIDTLIEKVKKKYNSYHVAETKEEIGKLVMTVAYKNIILVDRKPAKQSKHSKHSEQNGDEDHTRRRFNAIETDANGDQVLREYRAIITDNAESVEYFDVRSTYIIDIPTDRNECIQARNRAFRLCSHYKLKQTGPKPTHTVKYVLVDRKVDGKQDDVIRRGAYALANAHYKDESESLLASAQRLDLSGGARPIGLSVTSAPKPVATYLIDMVRPEYTALLADQGRFAQYINQSSEITVRGAVTVFDVSSYLKRNQQKYVSTYDKRIQGLFAKTGESAVEFDLRGALYCAHHTLRGITFSNEARIPDTKSDGTLILRYGSGGGESGDRDGVKHIESDKTPVILENALESATVYTGVRTVYYEDAHKVQCIGRARFECFRAIGVIVEEAEEVEEVDEVEKVEHKKTVKPPARVFVGSEDRFRSFIGMLSSGYGYRGNCHDDAHDAKHTPMAIAMELRRPLLMGLKCTVSIGANIAYKESLTKYLEAELRVEEWTTLIEVKQGNKEKENLVSVSVSRKEKGAVHQDQKVLGTKDFTVSESDNADSISGITEEKEGKLTNDVLYVVPADKYTADEYKDLTKADFAPTIELRIGKKKKFKTRIGDINNIRCTAVIFVGDSYTEWNLARITASEYYSKK